MRFALLLIFTGMMLSLNAQSTKGNWSKKDKKLLAQALKSVDKELEDLGEYKQPYLDCYSEKLENNYSSFRQADLDTDGCTKYAEACATDILNSIDKNNAAASTKDNNPYGSSIGNWGKKDKKLMAKAVKEIDAELDVLGDQKQAFIDCYSESIMNNYISFRAADQDPDGCTKLAEICANNVLETGSNSETGDTEH